MRIALLSVDRNPLRLVRNKAQGVNNMDLLYSP